MHGENPRVPPALPDISSTLRKAAEDAAKDAEKGLQTAVDISEGMCKLKMKAAA